MQLFDFACDTCSSTFEELVNSGVKLLPCPNCGATAKRQISVLRIDKYGMSLRSGATPTSIDYFDKIHRKQRAIEERAMERNGDYGTAPGSDGGRLYAPVDLSGATLVPQSSTPSTPKP